jgi:hypothetical protein
MNSPDPSKVWRECTHWSAGVGNAVALLISVVTLGQGGRIANILSRKGACKTCASCTRRQHWLNELGSLVFATLLGWWRSGTSALNALGRKITGRG